MPTKQQLAASLNKSVRDIEEFMADLGFNPRSANLTDEQAQSIASKLGEGYSLPPAPEVVEEAPKKGRKSSKITKAKQEALEQSAAAASLQSGHDIGETIKQQAVIGAAYADISSAAMVQGFLARKAANDQNFFAQFNKASVDQARGQIGEVDFSTMLKELGLTAPEQTVTASSATNADKSILDETGNFTASNWLTYQP